MELLKSVIERELTDCIPHLTLIFKAALFRGQLGVLKWLAEAYDLKYGVVGLQNGSKILSEIPLPRQLEGFDPKGKSSSQFFNSLWYYASNGVDMGNDFIFTSCLKADCLPGLMFLEERYQFLSGNRAHIDFFSLLTIFDQYTLLYDRIDSLTYLIRSWPGFFGIFISSINGPWFLSVITLSAICDFGKEVLARRVKYGAYQKYLNLFRSITANSLPDPDLFSNTVSLRRKPLLTTGLESLSKLPVDLIAIFQFLKRLGVIIPPALDALLEGLVLDLRRACNKQRKV